MSGVPAIAIQQALVRALNGRCVQQGAGVLSKNGERHESCATCDARCGHADLGLSGGVEVVRLWGCRTMEDISKRLDCQHAGGRFLDNGAIVHHAAGPGSVDAARRIARSHAARARGAPLAPTSCIQQEGGGEGGTGDCEVIFMLDNKYFKCTYSYSSYDGYYWECFLSSMREVTPKTVEVVIYD